MEGGGRLQGCKTENLPWVSMDIFWNYICLLNIQRFSVPGGLEVGGGGRGYSCIFSNMEVQRPFGVKSSGVFSLFWGGGGVGETFW